MGARKGRTRLGIPVFLALNGNNRRREGGREGGSEGGEVEDRIILLLIWFSIMAFALAEVIWVCFRDTYRRDTTYSLKTYACATKLSKIQTCTVSDYADVLSDKENNEFSLGDIGKPCIHRHKPDWEGHIHCKEGTLVDVCYFNIEKITDLGKWRKVDR